MTIDFKAILDEDPGFRKYLSTILISMSLEAPEGLKLFYSLYQQGNTAEDTLKLMKFFNRLSSESKEAKE